MAALIYAGDWIRRNIFLHSSDPLGIIGWFGVATSRDACMVARAL